MADRRVGPGEYDNGALLDEQPHPHHESPTLAPAQMRARVLGLAWPVIAENILETMLGIVDTALVARLGPVATAGVGSALQVMFFLISALSALSIGSSVLVAQAVGARDMHRASQYANQSITWSVLISIPFALAGYFLASPVLGLFRLEPAVHQVATEYLQVTMATIVVMIVLFIGRGVLRGAGDTRTPMIVTGIANVVNAGMAYGLIYGHWGLPAMGAVGSAWAAFAARALAAVLVLIVLWRGSRGISIRGNSWRPAWPTAKQMLNIGLPASLEQVLSSASFFVLTLVVAGLGTTILAAQQIAFTALSTSFLPGIGFSIAATTLVGQSIGAHRIQEGEAAARIALTWAVIWMSTAGALLFIFAKPVIGVFTQDQAVIEAGADGLRVIAFMQPLWATGMVLAGALRGSSDTRFPMVIGSAGMWLSVGLAALLTSLGARNLGMIWAAFIVVAPFTSLLYWRRLKRRFKDYEQEP